MNTLNFKNSFSSLLFFIRISKKSIFIFLNLVLFIHSIHAQSIPMYVPTSGLKAFWTFDGNANDNTGNGNNGTISGATLTSDRFNMPGKAYNFNGSSDNISTTMTGILGNNPRAVSFWAKTTEGVSTMCAVSWGDEQVGVNAGSRYECGFNYASTGASIIGADCVITYSTTSNIAGNAWHHYVYQFSGGQLNQVQIYQDGVLATQTLSAYYPNTVLNTSNIWKVSFGSIPYSVPHYFYGQLDEIGIWNRPLTLCEIKTLYQSSASTLSASSSNTALCAGQSATLTSSGANTYTWSNSLTGSSIVVSPNTSTTYSVSGTNTLTGCSGTTSIALQVNSCVGLKEQKFIVSNLEVFPNPFKDQLTFKGNMADKTEIKVVLIDILGREFITEKFYTSIDMSEHIIHLSELNLNKGIYFLRLEVNGSFQTIKLIME